MDCLPLGYVFCDFYYCLQQPNACVVWVEIVTMCTLNMYDIIIPLHIVYNDLQAYSLKDDVVSIQHQGQCQHEGDVGFKNRHSITNRAW